jgi:hypothetical protein
MRYRILLAYNSPQSDKADAKIKRVARGKHTGSGSGPEGRELDFEYDTEEDQSAAYNRLRRLSPINRIRHILKKP